MIPFRCQTWRTYWDREGLLSEGLETSNPSHDPSGDVKRSAHDIGCIEWHSLLEGSVTAEFEPSKRLLEELVITWQCELLCKFFEWTFCFWRCWSFDLHWKIKGNSLIKGSAPALTRGVSLMPFTAASANASPRVTSQDHFAHENKHRNLMASTCMISMTQIVSHTK